LKLNCLFKNKAELNFGLFSTKSSFHNFGILKGPAALSGGYFSAASIKTLCRPPWNYIATIECTYYIKNSKILSHTRQYETFCVLPSEARIFEK
jgi:hypothetical protein